MARSKSRRGSPLYVTPSFELFGKSKDLILDNFAIFGPLYILPALAAIDSWLTNTTSLHGSSRWAYDFKNHAAGVSSPTFPTYSWGVFASVGFFALVFVVASFIVQVMTQAAQLRAAEGKHLNFGLLWDTAKKLGLRILGLYVVIGLLFLASLLPAGIGAIFGTAGIALGFVVTIILWIMIIRKIFLAPYVMLDQKLGIRDSLRASSELSDRNPGSIWGIIGVSILIGIISAIPYVGSLVSFVLAMLYSAAAALRYLELKKLPE